MLRFEEQCLTYLLLLRGFGVSTIVLFDPFSQHEFYFLEYVIASYCILFSLDSFLCLFVNGVVSSNYHTLCSLPVIWRVYAQATQTQVAKEGCNVIYITYVTRAGVALQATVENIRDFVWEIYHWDLRTPNNAKPYFFLNEMNKKVLPAIYSAAVWCLFVVLLFFWLYYVTTVTPFIERKEQQWLRNKTKKTVKRQTDTKSQRNRL